jgi:hypothetical protein
MYMDYFVVEYDTIGNGIERKVMMYRTERDLLEYLHNNKGKDICVYLGECVLDWS